MYQIADIIIIIIWYYGCTAIITTWTVMYRNVWFQIIPYQNCVCCIYIYASSTTLFHIYNHSMWCDPYNRAVYNIFLTFYLWFSFFPFIVEHKYELKIYDLIKRGLERTNGTMEWLRKLYEKKRNVLLHCLHLGYVLVFFLCMSIMARKSVNK